MKSTCGSPYTVVRKIIKEKNLSGKWFQKQIRPGWPDRPLLNADGDPWYCIVNLQVQVIITFLKLLSCDLFLSPQQLALPTLNANPCRSDPGRTYKKQFKLSEKASTPAQLLIGSIKFGISNMEFNRIYQSSMIYIQSIWDLQSCQTTGLSIIFNVYFCMLYCPSKP